MSDYPTNPERTVTVSAVDRVHWGPIIAGMFVTLSVLIIAMILAAAIGFGPAFDQAGRATYSWTSIIWGIVTALVAFGLGGYFAARWSGVLGSGRAATHGFLVWALAVPVLVFLLGAGLTPMLANQYETQQPIQATQMPDGAAITPEQARQVSNAAWWTLGLLAAGLIGAAAAGAAGANAPDRRRTVTGHTSA